MPRPIIATLDFEASGIDMDSYPIEVGVVLRNGDAYCSLIKPSEHWVHWNSEAESIHKISRQDLLQYGKPPLEVALHLNQLLTTQTVYCDCWVLDQPWLIKLFQQAGVASAFSLRDISHLLDDDEMATLPKTAKVVAAELNLTRHRATNDARILQLAYERVIEHRRPT